MKVTIIGLGLIGGSAAIDLRKSGLATHLTGVDISEANGAEAVKLGLVDVYQPDGDSLSKSDLVIMAIPVNTLSALLPQVLDVIPSHGVVIDMGSTKCAICRSVAGHAKRGQFVACHPLAGTENSGPESAFSGLFRNKINIICEQDKSNPASMTLAERVFGALGMKSIFMEPEEHDRHVAYVSHLSHVSSFLLGQTVLDIEKDEKNIFNLASSGFASTVRLAKSSPDMWAPIFEQNAEYLGQALAEYIMHLQRFQYVLMKKNTKELHKMLAEANKIRPVLEGISAQQTSKSLAPSL